jgi:hypothetical protein
MVKFIRASHVKNVVYYPLGTCYPYGYPQIYFEAGDMSVGLHDCWIVWKSSDQEETDEVYSTREEALAAVDGELLLQCNAAGCTFYAATSDLSSEGFCPACTPNRPIQFA